MNTQALELRGLFKRYPGFELGPLDLTVPRGSIYGLIGPNGAGKTTTLELLFGLTGRSGGEMRAYGIDCMAQEVEFKRLAAYVSPELNFQTWGKVGHAIRFIRGFYPDWDNAYCERLMQTFRLGANERINALSFGGRIKLGLLLALSHRPKLLILDEPTTGLDAISKEQIFSEMLASVADGERAILISSHQLQDLERFADHIGLLNQGHLILEGPTSSVLERFHKVEFFANDGFSLRPQAGLKLLRQSGPRFQVLLDEQSGARAWLQAQGAQGFSQTPVSLEELFVALLKDRNEKP